LDELPGVQKWPYIHAVSVWVAVAGSTWQYSGYVWSDGQVSRRQNRMTPPQRILLTEMRRDLGLCVYKYMDEFKPVSYVIGADHAQPLLKN
jgi:hypothetical protein